MKTIKRTMALLLVFVMVLSCLPMGAITSFAEETTSEDSSATEIVVVSNDDTSTGEPVHPLFFANKIRKFNLR